MSDGCLGRHRMVSWDINCGHGQGSHCMLGRRRSGTRVADSHQVVKASLRQPELQTPTQWCGKVTRLCQRTGKGVVVLGRAWGTWISLPENCSPRQRSTQFCSAVFSLCRISSARGFCCCSVLRRGPITSSGLCNLHSQSDPRLLTMRTCGIAPRSCWTQRGQ